MSLRLLSIAVIMSLVAVRVEAIELFTNFHNGENLGFPPMEVPIRMYPGFGRGGWAPGVVGAPLKTMPPVPAMSPTGPAPMMFQRDGWSHMETGMNASPPQTALARNGRRQRFNGRTLPPVENRAAGKSEIGAPTAAEASQGMTVLKPQIASPPDLDERSIAAESNRESSTVKADSVNSDADSSSFFKNATSGW